MSVIFQPTEISNLYATTNATGWIAYLFPNDQTEQYDSITLDDSLNEYKGIYLFSAEKPDIEGTDFISSIWSFLNSNHSGTGHFVDRCLLWLNKQKSNDPRNLGEVIVFNETNYIGTTPAVNYASLSQRMAVNDSIFMAIPPYSKVSIANDSIKIARQITSITGYRYGLFLNNTISNSFIRLGNIDTAGIGMEKPISVPMSGANGGCLQFNLSFPFTFDNPSYFPYGNDNYPFVVNADKLKEYTILETGAKYYYPDTEKMADVEMIYEFFKETKPAGFRGSIDFSDILNQTSTRTYFAFNGKNIESGKITDDTILPSLFPTNFGKTINLAPIVNFQSDGSPASDSALLVFSDAILSPGTDQERLYWTLQGDFSFNSVDNVSAEATNEMLLCGVSGTETISFNTAKTGYPGDRISFIPKKPAFAENFLTKENAVPTSNESSLLTAKYTTAWATVKKDLIPQGNANSYFSQPNNAPLFEPGLLNGTLDYAAVPSANLIALSVDTSDSFPMATSAKSVPILGRLEPTSPGYYTQADINKFELEILNPARKQIISDYYKAYLSQMVRTQAEEEDECPIENLTTTPQGFLINLNSDKTEWKCLTLANNEPTSADSTDPLVPLQFKNITSANDITGIQSAFQTNEQFLVISDPRKAGSPDILKYYKDNFKDEIGIADWPFILDITHQNTESNTDSEFTNIMIFKFCSKSIEDRIKDTQLWTDPTVFNNESKIPSLIKWIQDYIETARKSISALSDNADSENDGISIQAEGFKKFIQLIEDPNWQGVLTLQVTLNLKSLPSEIKAILAGIDTSRFAAHHMGIEANQIKTSDDNKLDTDFKSSLFGMISYFNTTYLSYQNGTATPPLIYPKSPGDYDFQVLDLQVLFTNSLISDFNSKIQLNLNIAFDESVVSESAPGNGAIYKNSILMNGQYDKKNGSTSYTFTVARSNALTVSSTALDVVTITAVEMATVDDASLKEKETTEDDAWITTRFNISGFLKFQEITEFDLFSYESLYFSNLLLDMKFNLDIINPGDQTPKKEFTFIPENIAFKQEDNDTRSASLIPHFPIELDNLIYYNPATQNQEGSSSSKPVTPSSLGYMQVDAPIPTAPVGNVWYALRFNLNMGSIGALASKVGFNSEVILAWSPGKSNNQAQIYAKMPFSGGIAGTSFSIEGVLKFAIGSILFFKDPKISQYSMVFTEVGVSLLGKKLPPGGSTILYLFGNPDDPMADNSGKSNLGWFGAYKKDPDPA